MIRKANEKDINKIVEMKLKMFEESGHLHLLSKDASTDILSKYYSTYEEGTAQHFVIEDKDEIVACAGAFLKNDLPYCFYSEPIYGFVGDVYTNPEYRHRGYAHLLMNEVIEWLKAKGINTVRLLASAEARAMYEALGFVPTDEMVLRLEKI